MDGTAQVAGKESGDCFADVSGFSPPSLAFFLAASIAASPFAMVPALSAGVKKRVVWNVALMTAA